MLTAHHSDDPAVALAAAQGYLESDPVMHNLVLTLVAQRIAHHEPGHYWWVDDGGDVTGFAMQSPVGYRTTVTPMARRAVEAIVDAAIASAPATPGVGGEAATAACFAGVWAERCKVPARPHEGQRLYVLTDIAWPAGVPGALRPTTVDDVELLLEWERGFCADTGMPRRIEPGRWVRDNITHGRSFIWDDGAPVSTAIISDVTAGVSRVGFVYTPPERRGHGYAAAIVAGVSAEAMQRGADRCILYTQLANPTSNAVYQRLGYRAVAEVLDYTFG